MCRHLDGDPQNNRVENLRWGTPRENYDDRRRHGNDPVGERHSMARLTERAVRAIRTSDMTNAELAARYRVSPSTVSMARRRRSWRHMP